MARLSNELLHKYQDEELSSSQKRLVDEQLARSAESKSEIEKLQRLGEFIRMMGDEMSAQVSFEGFAERVAAGIRADRRVTMGEKVSVFIKEFFEHRRQIWISAACAAAAVLAVVVSVPIFHSGAGDKVTAWTASADSVGKAGSLIQDVSFGDLRGTVYQVDDGQGGTAGVVWIVE
jgi:hypothetical protein